MRLKQLIRHNQLFKTEISLSSKQVTGRFMIELFFSGSVEFRTCQQLQSLPNPSGRKYGGESFTGLHSLLCR